MELTIENLIKIILGVFVVVVVVFGIYLFFKNNVIEFFKEGKETANILLNLII